MVGAGAGAAGPLTEGRGTLEILRTPPCPAPVRKKEVEPIGDGRLPGWREEATPR